MDGCGKISSLKKEKGPAPRACAVPTPTGRGMFCDQGLLPGDDPVAALVAVVVPGLDGATVLVGSPGCLHAAGFRRVERVGPIVAPVAEVVAVKAVTSLVFPVAGARGGFGAGGVVVVLVVVPVVVVLGGVVAVLVGIAVVGIGPLVDAAREEHGGSRQQDRQKAHGIPRFCTRLVETRDRIWYQKMRKRQVVH